MGSVLRIYMHGYPPPYHIAPIGWVPLIIGRQQSAGSGVYVGFLDGVTMAARSLCDRIATT